jgi:N-acetylmuramoyl-L-alanine amidase
MRRAVLAGALALAWLPGVRAEAAPAGTVLRFGDAADYGSLAGQDLQAPIGGMAATPDGGGYWLVAGDGGVFGFGNAAFHGSTGGMALNAPIVGMAATPTGLGYWLVAADGGVFSYGDAHFLGSTGGATLNQPVVGMARSPTGGGYWLVASDGGIFNYGDAPFRGSTGGTPLNAPIVGMAASATGQGYWLAASDGGVFNYGDAPFEGSAGGAALAQPVAAIAASPSGRGYWLAEGMRLAGKVIVLDPGHNGGNAAHPEVINQLVDIRTGTKACDTTGAATNDGYPEWAFTLDVAQRAAASLRRAGATVVLTRTDSRGVGPCINQRAAIGNQARAAAAVSIHADGGPAGGFGFHVIRPGRIPGGDDAILAPSSALALAVRDQYGAATGEPRSNYVGSDGLDTRTDLGGLNLSTVPKVFIECANMRNGSDAARIEDPAFRQRMADGVVAGLEAFLA